MPIPSEDLRQSLLASDPEFRRLAEEHSRCESQLEEILESFYVNSEALMQEATLKRQKLYLKDRMELILARTQHAVIR